MTAQATAPSGHRGAWRRGALLGFLSGGLLVLPDLLWNYFQLWLVVQDPAATLLAIAFFTGPLVIFGSAGYLAVKQSHQINIGLAGLWAGLYAGVCSALISAPVEWLLAYGYNPNAFVVDGYVNDRAVFTVVACGCGWGFFLIVASIAGAIGGAIAKRRFVPF